MLVQCKSEKLSGFGCSTLFIPAYISSKTSSISGFLIPPVLIPRIVSSSLRSLTLSWSSGFVPPFLQAFPWVTSVCLSVNECFFAQKSRPLHQTWNNKLYIQHRGTCHQFLLLHQAAVNGHPHERTWEHPKRNSTCCFQLYFQVSKALLSTFMKCCLILQSRRPCKDTYVWPFYLCFHIYWLTPLFHLTCCVV